MHLSLFVRQRDGHAQVDVEGEIDINSAPWLQQRLLHLLGEDAPSLVVDLSGVAFIDCFAAPLSVRDWPGEPNSRPVPSRISR